MLTLELFYPLYTLVFGHFIYANINEVRRLYAGSQIGSQHEGPLQYLVGVYYDDSDIDIHDGSHTGGDLSLSFTAEPFGAGDSRVGQT